MSEARYSFRVSDQRSVRLNNESSSQKVIVASVAPILQKVLEKERGVENGTYKSLRFMKEALFSVSKR